MAKQINNALKVVISGVYMTHDRKHIDFENVHGIIPLCEEEFASAMVRARYAEMWITLSPKFKESVEDVRSVYIDVMEETYHEFSYVGKDIMELTYEELQDFATAKDLRAVPLYKSGGLRHGRSKAYVAFANEHLGLDVDDKAKGFNVATQPTIKTDADVEQSTRKTFTNDEILDIESDNTDNKTLKRALTRAQLEEMAESKNISFNPAISDAKLQEKVFNA